MHDSQKGLLFPALGALDTDRSFFSNGCQRHCSLRIEKAKTNADITLEQLKNSHALVVMGTPKFHFPDRMIYSSLYSIILRAMLYSIWGVFNHVLQSSRLVTLNTYGYSKRNSDTV